MAEKPIDSRITDPEGHQILKDTRCRIHEAAGSDPDRLFVLNRYVYSRLQLDERKQHYKLKRALFENYPHCYACKKELLQIRDLELHRLDSNRGYVLENCVLMHRECHQELHHASEQ